MVPGRTGDLVLRVVRRVRPGVQGRVVPGFQDIALPVLAHARGTMVPGGLFFADGFQTCCHVQ
jgi:hypothetical protein